MLQHRGPAVREASVSVFPLLSAEDMKELHWAHLFMLIQESRSLGLKGSGCRIDAEAVPSGAGPMKVPDN